MKPFSLSVLLLLASLAAQGEVVMVSGTVYDAGKGSHSQDTTVTNKADSQLCWAATSSNLFQHWQDAYGHAEAAPNDTTIGYTMPSGTQYLNIYADFVNNVKNQAGNLQMAEKWYFEGKYYNTTTWKETSSANCTYMQTGHGEGGYYKNHEVDGTKLTVSVVDVLHDYPETGGDKLKSLDMFKELLDTQFKQQGHAIYLGIKGAIGHAVTCWGYETDEVGTLTALYLTDSDDKQFGARRVDVTLKEGKLYLSSPFDNGTYSDGRDYWVNEIAYLQDNISTAKSGNTPLVLPEGNAISTAVDMTGQQISSQAGISTEAGSILAASGGEGTALTLGTDEGTVVGTGLAAKAGSLVSMDHADVSISHFTGDGLSVGCEVYLDKGDVSISHNGGAGIAVKGTDTDHKAYLSMMGNTAIEISDNQKGGLDIEGSLTMVHNDAVTIDGNTAAQGSALRITPTAKTTSPSSNSYTMLYGNTSVSDNGTVTISNNESSAGDVVFNQSKLTISDNERVTLSDNTAQTGGAVIHNAGTKLYLTQNSYITLTSTPVMEITNNGSITFTGNNAQYDIYNEGKLYLSANAGQSITFEHGILNSATGSTVLGKDKVGHASDGGTYVFSQGDSTAVMTTTTGTIKANGGATVLNDGGKTSLTLSKVTFDDDVRISLDAIDLILAEATFSKGLTVDLGYYVHLNKMDLSAFTITSGSLLMSLDLDNGSATPLFQLSGSGDGSDSLTQITVKMSDYISSSDSSLDSVQLALSVSGNIAPGTQLVLDTHGVNIDVNNITVNGATLGKTEDGKLFYNRATPEPSTATLSLLGLSLLLRRRRKAA